MSILEHLNNNNIKTRMLNIKKKTKKTPLLSVKLLKNSIKFTKY